MKPQHLIIAAMVCLMYVGAIAALLFTEPPQGARDALLVLIGGISTAFGQVIAYYFGSSAGSAEKTAMFAPRTSPTPKVTP